MFGDSNGQIKLRTKQKFKFLSATYEYSPNQLGKIWNWVATTVFYNSHDIMSLCKMLLLIWKDYSQNNI